MNRSEAIILRTWPIHEADLIVSFFTRTEGKVKGIAKAALKSRKRFGGALEPMTIVEAHYAIKPRQELVRLDQLEIRQSPLAKAIDLPRISVLSFFAEVLDEALPEHDAQETIYRLLTACIDRTNTDAPYLPLTYFSLWLTRLMGWLPSLTHCLRCGRQLIGDEARYHPQADGLFCLQHAPQHSEPISESSRQTAQSMLRTPIAAFTEQAWPRQRMRDLRHFLFQALERHLERRLRSVEALYKLGA